MKNYEKYADEIRDCNSYNSCDDFIKPYILKSDNCNGLGCFECNIRQMAWLLEDYKEPEVDWSKVEVDTPILVRDSEKTAWFKRHFAKYENGLVYAWKDSRTSWSAANDKDVTAWIHAKLAETEGAE